MKFNYYISTESTCDASDEIKNREMLKIIPMSYNFGEKIYYQGTEGDLSVPDFYNAVMSGQQPTTSALAPYYFEEAWEPILKNGFDILHLAFSSGLSGTYSNACIVAKEMMAKYPGRKILVLDSLNGSTGEGLMAYQMLELRENGKTMEEIIDIISEKLLNYRAYFTVDSLFHLARLGRVSKVASIIGSTLHLKPLLQLNKFGAIVQADKVIGRKSSLNWLARRCVDTIDTNLSDTVIVSDGNCVEDGNFVANIVRQFLPKIKLMRSSVGPLIGSHAGGKCLGIFFCSKDKRN